jgi:hypothetical protein
MQTIEFGVLEGPESEGQTRGTARVWVTADSEPTASGQRI